MSSYIKGTPMNHKAPSLGTFLNTVMTQFITVKTIFNLNIHKKSNFKSMLKFFKTSKQSLGQFSKFEALLVYNFNQTHLKRKNGVTNTKMLYTFLLKYVRALKYKFLIFNIVLPDPLN